MPPKALGKPSSEHLVDFEMANEMANWLGLTGELFRADAATFGPAGNISPWSRISFKPPVANKIPDFPSP